MASSGMRRLTFAVLFACAASLAPLRSASKARRTGVIVQYEQATLIGVGTALSGLVFGFGIAIFSEKQIERGEQRGYDEISDVTRARMSAMFMEDEALPQLGLDDTVARMEAALARAKGPEVEGEKKDAPAEPKPPKDMTGGW
ncbi:hypothetical protein M885DRAFT_526211 [Pelagophyceae sp. CCMP2097]|nr:hypothetical protein M885DRAFT_526211 [Pelagophyceae sp. CCMP2097]